MIELYIGTERLDLFKDEDVNITLNVQNIKDISKVFADYTQSFSLPASQNNNAVFKHYYNADISGGFQASLRQSGVIILDKEPFREGSFELLSVNMKNGKADSYEVVFFSAGVSLKDIFGEDELNDLDLSAYNHSYTGANVRRGAEGALLSGDVIYPLISPVGDWTFDSNSSSHVDYNLSYHTTNDNHGLHYYELKPALRMSAILDAIEAKYGISFTSTLLSSSKFTDLYMWCHRREGWMFKGQENGWTPRGIRWFAYQTGGTQMAANINGYWDVTSTLLNVDLSYNWQVVGGGVAVYVFVNDAQHSVRNYSAGSGTETIPINGLVAGDKVYIKYGPAQGSAGAAFDLYLTNLEFFRTQFPTSVVATASTGGTPNGFNNEVELSEHLPEQKVSDFITGLIKMFNLTLEPISSTSFKLETLDDWYAAGTTYDITEYTDIESVTIAKPELFRRISFKHQEANSNAMRTYRLQNGGVAYGDLRADFSFDGEELETQTSFELLRMDKLTDVNTSSSVDFLVGKAIDQNAEPYIGKPIIFYSGDVLDINANPIGFLDESGLTPSPADPLVEVAFMSNADNKVTDDVTQMLTFGLEIEPYHEQAFAETLYGVFWQDYVTDLYSTSRRLYKFKAVLPARIIYSLSMNDKLVIGGRRYIINQLQINLRTREAQMELLNDV